MVAIAYRCRNTSLNVQGRIADDPTEGKAETLKRCTVTVRRSQAYMPISLKSPPRRACRSFCMTCRRRTACGLADEIVARLAERPQIVGLKDTTGDPSRIARLRQQCH
jgi:hypothetical protein